jgi:hypothetical protein
MVAQVAYFSMVGDCECLACNHPMPDANIDQIVQDLQHMSAAEREAWFDDRDVDPASRAQVEGFLVDGNCGSVGAQELVRLGLEGGTDWSVAFVSVAAGIMVAAALVRAAMDGIDRVFVGKAERRIVFWKPEFLESAATRKISCPVCRSDKNQDRLRKLWGDV